MKAKPKYGTVTVKQSDLDFHPSTDWKTLAGLVVIGVIIVIATYFATTK